MRTPTRAGWSSCSAAASRTLELGAQAEKWAKRITSPPSRVDKLGVKAGMRIALVGMDDEALVEDIGAKAGVLETSARSKGLDMIFFAAQCAARSRHGSRRWRAGSSRRAPSG